MRPLTRRDVLRGTAGVALLLPALEACGRAGGAVPARAAATASQRLTDTATRFVGFKMPNGAVLEEWFPTGTEEGFSLGGILRPLEAHRSNMLVLKGVDNRVASATPNQLDGNHASGVASLLTGMMPVFPGGADDNGAVTKGQGPSIDQVIASHYETTGAVLRRKSLQLGPRTENQVNPSGCISHAGVEQPLVSQRDPAAVFNLLFDDASATQAELARRQLKRKSILDHTAADFAALATKVSRGDKARIEQHLEAVRDVEKRIFVPSACMTNGLMVPQAYADDAERRKAFLDLLVLALSCDLTRVATVTYHQSGGVNGTVDAFPWLGITEDTHMLSHMIVGSPAGSDPKQKFVQVLAWLHQTMGDFITKLKAVSMPGGGSLFDETVLFEGSDISIDHGTADMPFLIMAGAKTPFRTGRYVTFSPSVSHCDLLVSLLNSCGVDVATFGEPGYCQGSLNARLF